MEFNFSQKQQLQAQLDQLLASTQEIKSKLNGIDATERIAAECLQSITDTKKRLEECLLDSASMIEWQHEGMRRLGVSVDIEPDMNKIHNLEEALQRLAKENLDLKFTHHAQMAELEGRIKEVSKERDEIFEKYQTTTGAINQEDSENYEVTLQELSTLKKLYAEAVDKLKEQPQPEAITVEAAPVVETPAVIDTALTSILEIGVIVENQNGVFGEVIGFENEGINVRHVTGVKWYTRSSLRHIPGTNITIPLTEEVKLSANDFLAQNGIKKITWEQVRDWSGKDKEKLRDLTIAGANIKSKKAKDFVASLPQKCADYIQKTKDKSDLDWVLGQFKNEVEALLGDKEATQKDEVDVPVQQEIPILAAPSDITINDIVMTDDQQVGTILDLLPDNGAIVQIKEGEEKQYSLSQLTWLSSYVPEEKPSIEVQINGAYQEFWKKYTTSTVAFNKLDWVAISDIVEKSDTKLKELVSAAPASIQKKFSNGHLARLLVDYVKQSEDKSDLEWITEPLLTQVEELLAEAEIEEVEIEGAEEYVEYELQSVARVAGKNGLWTVIESKGSGWYTLKQGKDQIDAHANELEPLNVGF